MGNKISLFNVLLILFNLHLVKKVNDSVPQKEIPRDLFYITFVTVSYLIYVSVANIRGEIVTFPLPKVKGRDTKNCTDKP